MAKLKIVKYGDETLRKVCRPVETVTPRICTLLDDMIDTMRDAGGCGLAAPQVGVLRRVVVIETEEPAETDEDVAVDTDIIVEEPVIGGGIIGMPNPFPPEEFRVFLTEEMADEIIEFIKSLNHVYRYNVPVNNIIKEEAAQYFAGQKSLDDTVRIIQNRVFTYVAERR